MANEQPSTHYAPQVYYGSVTIVGAFYVPDGCIDNDAIGANASNPIDAEKVERDYFVTHETDVDSAAASFDLVKRICQAAGEVVDVEIAIVTPPTGDYKVNVDVQYWNGASWTTMLSSTVDVDNSYVANTPQSITLAGSITLADGYLIRIIGVASGSSGTQGQGLTVQVRCREKP